MLLEQMLGVFSRRDPVGRKAPVLFEIPRSGAEYPQDFRSIASLADLQRSDSMYVEECYSDVVDAGATWLYANCPNAYIDLNRHELDIDPGQLNGDWPDALRPGPKTRSGVGLIPIVCAGTKPIYEATLPVAEVQMRLDCYYWPYHAEVTRLLRTFRLEHGVAYHLSCHSMPAMPDAGAPDAGQRRSDFDLGNRDGTTCDPDSMNVVSGVLETFGYRVTRNIHYVGAECVRKHGLPGGGIHSLQIEMNRSLFMDEASRTRRPELLAVRLQLAAVAAKVVELAASKAQAR